MIMKGTLLPLMVGWEMILALFVLGFAVFTLNGYGYEVKHPIYPLKVDDLVAAQKNAEKVMSIPDETLNEWNPPKADFHTVGCPNCKLGTMYRSTNLSWSPDNPNQIQCKYCKHIYPSKDYPLDKSTKVISPAGTEQEYKYNLGKDDRHYYMESAMLNVRRFWLRSQAILLARLYTATKYVKYAKKAGVIIKRFAEIFPEIPVHGHDSMGKQDPIFYDVKIVSQPGKVQPVPEPFGHSAKKGYKSPYPYQSTRSGFGTRWVYDEVPLLLIYAYDQIADTLDAKSRKMIEEYSRQSVNYCRTFPRYLSNMDYLIAQWETVCGRVIGEPEFVHGGVIRIRKMFEFAHYPDGVWFEGAPYYAATVVRHLNLALESLEGYKDPEGFVGIEDKNTFAPLDLSPFREEKEHIEKGLQALGLPDGNLCPVYDTFSPIVAKHKTHFSHYTSAGEFKPIGELLAQPKYTESKPRILWAAGLGILAFGKNENQMQVRMQFMGNANSHNHLDRLGIQLYAKGREMESDIGYSQTDLRPYVTAVVSHNTVMVDEDNQKFIPYTPIGGIVECYHTEHPVVQFMSVSTGYAFDQASKYRRSLSLVKISEEDRYLVDLFEVEGGKQHDWLLHGDADLDGAVKTSLELMPRKGSLHPEGKEFVMWENKEGTGGGGPRSRENVQNSLALIKNIRAAKTNDIWQATFSMNPDDGTGLRITMLDQPDTEVMAAEMPSIRRALEVNADVLKYWMPLIVARRTGEKLSSRFLAIHEPYKGKAFIESVSREGNAIIVKTKNFTDVHLFGEGTEKYRFKGRYAFLRFENDKLKDLYFADAAHFVYGNYTPPEISPAVQGTVISVNGKELILSCNIPLTFGSAIQLFFPSGEVYWLPIEKMLPKGAITEVMLKEDPQFTLAKEGIGGKLNRFPNSSFNQKVQFRITRFGKWQEKEK